MILALALTLTFGQAEPRWELVAHFWLAEVADPELSACMERTHGRGRLELRLNARGEIALAVEKGDEPFRQCAAWFSARWHTSRFDGGWIEKLSFPPRTEAPEGDTFPWREPKAEFLPCAQFNDCGAGQVCDSGVCVDTISSWRVKARARPK
jgi:hypothetical protein